MKAELPKLLFIGDVSVELLSAGATLLFRLLENYPADRLRVIQSNPKKKERSLPNVQYYQLEQKLASRLRKTRFFKVGSFLELVRAKRNIKLIQHVIDDFNPDAILTVSFRFLWIQAHLMAKKNNLPLYLILHDDITTSETHGLLTERQIERHLKKSYKDAADRFCISDKMEEMYFQRYGVRGKVIYPTMSREDKVLPVHSSMQTTHLNFCYAGSLVVPDAPVMLNDLAGILSKYGHRLTLFTDASKDELHAYPHLLSDHVEINDMVHPDVLLKHMSDQVDVNILLNSFEREYTFRWNFSSKLVEYTKVGLPVLAWGASTSGAIDWMYKNSYKGILSEYSLAKLSELIQQLGSPDIRKALAIHFQAIGAQTFDFSRNYEVFLESLRLIPHKKKSSQNATVSQS